MSENLYVEVVLDEKNAVLSKLAEIMATENLDARQISLLAEAIGLLMSPQEMAEKLHEYFEQKDWSVELSEAELNAHALIMAI